MTPPSYELIRSARRTLALEVSRDGRVLVRAPMGLSQKRIDAFAAAHQDWIAAQQARQAQRRAAHPEPSAAERAGLIRKAQEPRRINFSSSTSKSVFTFLLPSADSCSSPPLECES